MSEMDELNDARYKLTAALGEQSKQYFQRMKLWFQMKISKEQFDIESRKSLTAEQIHLHNRFLLCLFTKCQGMATASYVRATSSRSQSDDALADSNEILSPSERAKKVKMSRRRGHPDRGAFEPIEVVDYLPSLQPPSYPNMDELHRSCAHEVFLPDQSFLMGRLMLAAWDCGMDGANEAAADVLVVAVQHFLKSMLTSIFSQRSGYRIRNGHFVYGMGKAAPNPWLRNSNRIPDHFVPTEILDLDQDLSDPLNMDDNLEIHVSMLQPTLEEMERRANMEMPGRDPNCPIPPLKLQPTLEEMERRANMEMPGHDPNCPISPLKLQPTLEEVERHSNLEMACSVPNRPLPPPVSAWDVLEALQVHRNKVCSQSVYAINVERVLNKISHSTWDDEEAAAARARGRTT